MAVDETLLESALNNGISTIRVYRWAEAALSLGYFQNPADVANDPVLSGLPMVRRLSGGGAIVHHHEVTYSVALAPDHFATDVPTRLYSMVHNAVIAWLAKNQVLAAMRGAAFAGAATEEEAFLCFSRGDPHDIVLDGHKILGSAQRRRRGAVLQHGSLVLRASPFAPDLPGLFDLDTAAQVDETGCDEEYSTIVASSLSESLLLGALTPEEHARAEQLERERYRSVEPFRSRR